MKGPRLIASMTLGALAFVAEATEQQKDPLFWKGQEVVYANGPDFKNAPFAGRMNFELTSTANWKGYTAMWKIEEGALYLCSLSGRIDGKEMTMADFIPGQKKPIQAAWYSGTIIIAAGEEIGEMKGRFRKVFATEIHVSVENGNVKQKTVKDFHPGRDGVKGLGVLTEVAVPNAGEPIPARAFLDR